MKGASDSSAYGGEENAPFCFDKKYYKQTHIILEISAIDKSNQGKNSLLGDFSSLLWNFFECFDKINTAGAFEGNFG